MAELAARIVLLVLECGFEYVGYYTMRVLLPLLTFGRCRVATPDRIHDLWAPAKDAGVQPATAATLGILFWLLVAIAVALFLR
jgi:hypothetical protein